MKTTPPGGNHARHSAFSRFVSDYGMIFVLVLLCVFYSWATYVEQSPTGAAGAEQLGRNLSRQLPKGAKVLIVVREHREDAAFAEVLSGFIQRAGMTTVEVVKGQPSDARASLQKLAAAGQKLDAIAVNQSIANWSVFEDPAAKFPGIGSPKTIYPHSYRWPNFLKTDNLLNIANQIAVIAIIAIGMTFVILTAGIDLSVGSLIALAAVVAAWFIRNVAGAEHAGAAGMILSCLAAILLCGLVGTISGLFITFLEIPAFIVTLAMMLVGSGFAYIAAHGQSIYQVPDSFVWLGRGDMFGVPNAVLLMALLYLVAHVIMTRTVLGRYIYAIGGNAEAARLSGVPVKAVLILVYSISGLLAGLGGIVMASQLKSGSPTYGQMYELYVIAAVVVGGTSLVGGEGKVLGTLIGAFIIAVIQNGMNLTNVESYTQKVVLGLVILGAVLLDMLKRKGWNRLAIWKKRREQAG